MQSNVRKRNVEKNEKTSKPLSEILNNALKSEADWSDKDEFLDVVYWMRQILGLILGIVWGVVALKGFIGLASFFAINTGLTYAYSTMYQKVDEEEYGGVGEILKEGLMTSFATFLVTWIIVYSSLHTSA